MKPNKRQGLYWHTYFIDGETEVEIGYEYFPGEPAVFDLNSPFCGPGTDAEVVLHSFFVKGVGIDCSVLKERIQDAIVNDILESWSNADIDYGVPEYD